MLRKQQRLTNGRDFKRVYQKGSFFSVGLFSANWMPNKTPNTRIGIVISKKIAPKSVDRNVLKRRFREIARKIYDKFPAGFDVIIVIKDKAKKASFEEIEKEVADSIKRIGVKYEKNRH